MKKLFLFLAIGLLAFSSCKKEEEPEPEIVCYTCEYGQTDEVEICEDDLPSGYGSIENWKNAYEAAGYNCKKK